MLLLLLSLLLLILASPLLLLLLLGIGRALSVALLGGRATLAAVLQGHDVVGRSGHVVLLHDALIDTTVGGHVAVVLLPLLGDRRGLVMRTVVVMGLALFAAASFRFGLVRRRVRLMMATRACATDHAASCDRCGRQRTIVRMRTVTLRLRLRLRLALLRLQNDLLLLLLGQDCRVFDQRVARL